MSQLAQLELWESGDVVVASITGELDLSNVHDVGDVLSVAVGRDAAGLVLDLTGLMHIDSAGVRLLFDLRGRLATARQRLALVVPAGARILEVLEMAAVGDAIPVTAALDEAVAAAGS